MNMTRLLLVLVTLLFVAALVTFRTTLTPSEEQRDAITRPAYLATAVSPTGDVNLLMRGDGAVIRATPARFDSAGHARLPAWDADALGVLAVLEQPVAPLMGWGVTFMTDVAAKRRALYYCLQERREYDRQNGTSTAAIGLRAIRAVFDQTFDVLPSQEDCGRADMVLGANAETDCGSMSAWGCAALQFAGARPFVRVTFNGALLRDGTMRPECIERAIDWHELKHAGDLGHTGAYGDERGPHAHRSDLGFVDGGTCYPADNQGAAAPAAEDWDDGTGRGNRYGLRRRDAPPPPSPPSPPSPTPSPVPRPSPSPAPWKFDPPPTGSYEREWFDRGFNHAYCRLVDPWNGDCQ